MKTSLCSFFASNESEPKSQYVDDEAAEGSDDENADEMEVDRDEAEVSEESEFADFSPDLCFFDQNNELDEDETARGSWSESDTMSDTPVPAGKRAKYKFRSVSVFGWMKPLCVALTRLALPVDRRNRSRWYRHCK